MNYPPKQGLYDPRNEHDACGVGFVTHIKGVKTHDTVKRGLEILLNLDHRGAVGADPLLGDGAGILIQIPDTFLRAEMAKQDIVLPPVGEYGVGMVFLPRENASRMACQEEIERAVAAEGQVLLGWRDVPVSSTMPMSPTVKAKEPVIRQVFVGRGPDVFVTDALERKLYIIRRRAANAIKALGNIGDPKAVPTLVDAALQAAGEHSDNVTVLAIEWESPADAAFEHSGFTETQVLSDEVFASTIQAGAYDPLLDDLDDEAIERSIAEINAAIQRTAMNRR